MKVNLVMFRESGERRDFPLTDGKTVIGRKDDCDIRIPLIEISRHHAEIVMVDSGAEIRDLGSANGTFVNNKRVAKPVKLAPGDHVVVGPVVFTVQLDGKPEKLRAVKTKLRTVPASSDSSAAAAAGVDDALDPISALEALASSAEQTAIDPFDEEDVLS